MGKVRGWGWGSPSGNGDPHPRYSPNFHPRSSIEQTSARARALCADYHMPKRPLIPRDFRTSFLYLIFILVRKLSFLYQIFVLGKIFVLIPILYLTLKKIFVLI